MAGLLFVRLAFHYCEIPERNMLGAVEVLFFLLAYNSGSSGFKNGQLLVWHLMGIGVERGSRMEGQSHGEPASRLQEDKHFMRPDPWVYPGNLIQLLPEALP